MEISINKHTKCLQPATCLMCGTYGKHTSLFTGENISLPLPSVRFALIITPEISQNRKMEVQVVTAMTAIIACFGLTAAQAANEMGAKVVAGEVNEHEIRENVRNLFESILKNDVKNTDTYRNILVQQAAGEQQDFDAMKTRLEFVRQRNAHKQRNSLIMNGETGKRSAAFKRETPRNKLWFSDEEKFVNLYGNDPETSGRWECVRNFSSKTDWLKRVALQAHKRADMLPTESITSIAVEERTLDFSYAKFEAIKLDTIVYKFKELPSNPLYIGKGLAPDCIFYLTQWDNHGLIFHLGIPFCGIKLCS